MTVQLEHANVTVSDVKRTAAWMADLFGWHTRWEGPSKDGGVSIHVGSDSQYIALYQPARAVQDGSSSYVTRGGLNHLAVVVDNIDEMERAVIKAGFTPESHADYEPGLRFYFHDHDDIEYEVVQYT